MSVQVIPLSKLVPTHHLLRPVDKNEVEYLELRDSLAASGQLNSILVRPAKDKYEIVDGMYRYTVALELCWETLECSVHDIPDDEIILKQLQCNSIRPETNPVDFAKALKKILVQNEDMDMVGLSNLVKKSGNWIRSILGLLSIRVKYQNAVNKGIMPLLNAYKLSKLPGIMQDDLYESACIMSTTEFGSIANEAILQFKSALKTGKLERFRSKFVDLKPYLKTLKDLKQEVENPENISIMLAKYPCNTIIEACILGIKFAMNIDPHTLDERKERYEVIEQKRINLVKPFKQNQD